jgi:hypothetical protein
MSRPVLLVLLALGVAAACERPAQQDESKQHELAAKVLTGLLAYPPSSLVDISAGQDAAQATLLTAAPVQQVATWYREMLRLNGWDLKNDVMTNDSAVAMYAEKDKRPLWITLKAEGRAGTRYTLIGAELPRDSAQDQRSGSSMSSNRIQRR